jgi:hypothetical protein
VSGKALAKEAFLAADDRKLVRVGLAEAYGAEACVYVRVMSGKERSEVEKIWAGPKKPSTDPGGFRWDLLVRCVADEEGRTLFEEGDREAVMQKSSATLETLFEAACRENGFRDKDVEELEGN